MTIETSSLGGAVVYLPDVDPTPPQGVRVSNLGAVVVYMPSSGTSRDDLLSIVEHLGVTAITQTGVTKQGDIPVDREDSELTTGELTVVRQLTVTWSSGPTTEQLAAFNRTVLGSPIYEVTHG